MSLSPEKMDFGNILKIMYKVAKTKEQQHIYCIIVQPNRFIEFLSHNHYIPSKYKSKNLKKYLRYYLKPK